MLTKSLHLRQRRPSMLSHPKYRHKEEKRKLMKLTCRKLKKLEDPESVLCKAVLINNTLKYLQQNSPSVSQGPPCPRLLADSETESELDILNTEIQFPPPLPPLQEENISTENEFFNLCCDQLPTSDHQLRSVEMTETQELYRDFRDRNDLRLDSDTAASGEESEEISYQDQSSQVYNISSYGSSSSSQTNNISNCSNTASHSQSLLNLPLHRIVECKV